MFLIKSHENQYYPITQCLPDGFISNPGYHDYRIRSCNPMPVFVSTSVYYTKTDHNPRDKHLSAIEVNQYVSFQKKRNNSVDNRFGR